MATSGSYNFSVNRDDILAEGYRVARLIGQDQVMNARDIADGAMALNLIVKQWQAKSDFAPGLKVWSRKRLTLFLAKGQSRYLIGPASTDARCTEQYGRTTISAAEALGQTVISITSNTDTTTYPGTTVTMTSGDFVAVELNDGTLQWTTISGTPAATMTVADALTASASAGNYVYWFTSRAQRFPLIEYAALRIFGSTAGKATDQGLAIYRDVQEYESLPDKTASGDPTAILIEPLRITTAVTLNSQPQDVRKVVQLTAQYPSEDYDTLTDDVAYPQEWYRALAYQLGMDLCIRGGKAISPDLKLMRDEALSMAQQVNFETSGRYFEPERY